MWLRELWYLEVGILKGQTADGWEWRLCLCPDTVLIYSVPLSKSNHFLGFLNILLIIIFIGKMRGLVWMSGSHVFTLWKLLLILQSYEYHIIMVSVLWPSEIKKQKKPYNYTWVSRLAISPESLWVQIPSQIPSPNTGAMGLADFAVPSGSDILRVKSGECGSLRKHSLIPKESWHELLPDPGAELEVLKRDELRQISGCTSLSWERRQTGQK